MEYITDKQLKEIKIVTDGLQKITDLQIRMETIHQLKRIADEVESVKLELKPLESIAASLEEINGKHWGNQFKNNLEWRIKKQFTNHTYFGKEQTRSHIIP